MDFFFNMQIKYRNRGELNFG